MSALSRELRFSNERGEQLAATFQWAHTSVPSPGVLLCQGLSGVRNLVMPEVAEALADAGIATLRFDYSGFGESEGDRGWINPLDRANDARIALAALQAQAEVDSNRIGVYGHSYGGPVALQLAASVPDLGALAAISSPGSGTDMLRAARPAWDWVALKRQVLDERGRIDRGEAPAIVPIEQIFPFSPAFAAGYAKLKQSQGGTSALQGTHGLGKDSFYLASVDCMASLRLLPLATGIVNCPCLFISGELDDTAPIETIEPIFESIPATKEWIVVAGADHNALDSDPGLRAALASVTTWFQSHLCVQPSP
ncbi:MAG: alpha/beta hydrolase [Actinomycetota bacterium]|nr:alpha/beta hydrolase [Actinomycetota bacterium]